MKLSKLKYLPSLTPAYAYFEGEGDAGAGDTGAGNGGAGTTPKTFTQEDVNRLLAENRRNIQKELAEKTAALSDIQNTLNLTAEEKDLLANRVNELNNALLTKEELAKREKQRLQDESKAALERATSEGKFWKTRHDDMLITSALMGAVAIEGQKAYNPAQIVELFKGKAVIVEDPSSKALSVKVKVALKGADGQVKTLDLDPVEAMKEVAAMPEYANLFNFDGKSGLGKNKPRTSMTKGGVPLNFNDYKEHRSDYVGQN